MRCYFVRGSLSKSWGDLMEDLGTLLEAHKFLRSSGYLSDFDKNNLIAVPMAACKWIEKISYDIRLEEKKIDAHVSLGAFAYLLLRGKIEKQLKELYADGYPEYQFNIIFKKLWNKD